MSGVEPGFFGKLPSNGDFITRRLSRDYLDVWDEWLQQCVAASRASLGDDAWLNAYLTAPLWCFALQPGICGAQAWTGLLMPSVDRVGRYFPLTLAVTLPPGVSALQAALCGAGWFSAARRTALEALEDDSLVLDDFDQAVASLGPLDLNPPAHLAMPDMTDSTAGVRLALNEQGPSALLLPLAEYWARPATGGYSVWWTEGSEAVEPTLLWQPALPRPAAFSSLLTGDWQSGNWLNPVSGPAIIPEVLELPA